MENQAHSEALASGFDPLADVAVEQSEVPQRRACGTFHGAGQGRPGDRLRDDEREVPADGRILRQGGRARQRTRHRRVKLKLEGVDIDVEVERLLRESFRAAGDPEMNPFGIEANRRNLEVAIEFCYRQDLIPRRYAVEELFA